MEPEVKKEKTPRFERRVSLFRRRKKRPIRSAVRAHKNHNYKRLITNIILVVIGIFILVTVLYIIRMILLPKVFIRNDVIITPQGNSFPDNNQIKNIIQNTGLKIDTVTFASDSATVTFNLNSRTYVLLSLKKDIRGQIDLVEAIDEQLKQDGKQAIYIDLRYNKPVVKF